jgi:hypothetical protein
MNHHNKIHIPTRADQPPQQAGNAQDDVKLYQRMREELEWQKQHQSDEYTTFLRDIHTWKDHWKQIDLSSFVLGIVVACSVLTLLAALNRSTGDWHSEVLV